MSGRIKIVAIVDEPALAEEIRLELGSRSDLDLVTSAAAGLTHMHADADVDLAIVPEMMAGSAAVAIAAELRRVRADLPVLVLSRTPESRDLTAALRGKQITETVQLPWRRGELVAAAERMREVSRLRRELKATRKQMHRRLEAMNVRIELTSAIANASSYDDLARIVARGLYRIAPSGMGAAMVSIDERTILHLHCHQACSQEGLRAARDRSVETFCALTGRSVHEERLVVEVGGERLTLDSEQGIAGLFTYVPIHLDAKVVGIIMVDTRVDSDCEKLMYFVAERAAETYRRLYVQRDNERRRLSLIVESMADGLIFIDAISNRVLVNPAVRQMLGLVADAAVAMGDIDDKLGFSPLEAVQTRSSGNAEPIREELELGDHTLHAIVSPVHDRASKLVGVVVVLRDITESKELSRRQSEFISLINHELRTPLTQISVALDMMLGGYAGRITDKQKSYLEAANDSYGRLSTLIENLLDMARVERDEMVGEVMPVALDELTLEVVERHRRSAMAKQIELSLAILDKRIRLLGDPDRLTQVLDNLLSNAIKFTPEGGRIEVEAFVSPVVADHVGVSVYNTGEPIPRDALERIFSKFEQLEETATRQAEGAGLGLPLSRAIIKAHQGYIWAVPLDTGMRFEFILPVTPTTEPSQDIEAPSEVDSGRMRAAEPHQGQAAPAHKSEAVVLIVDDARQSKYMLLQGILSAAGYVVHQAPDADSALTLARAQPPDLAVINMSMTEGRGADLIEIFAHDPDTRKTAVLVVSSSEGARDEAMRANADEFLLMPVQPDRFLETCTRLIAEAGRANAHRVLLVDDNATIRMLCRDALERKGYEVYDAANGTGALEAARRFRPDVMVLDIMMPEMDGFQTAEKFRADPATSMTPIIFLSAKGQTADKVRAFRAGAEDYMVKPFHTDEFVARVEKCLERQARELGASPTTQLPGADSIEAEIERRLARRGHDAFCYLDLDNLKAFNDYYGYAKADGIIRQTGDIIRDAVAREGQHGDFIGHIAGDDFVFVTGADRVTNVCMTICATFDRLVPLYYNKDDRERGFIETKDRYGEMRRFPLMTVSIAVVTLAATNSKSFSDLAAAAAMGKKMAKELVGSSYVLDSVPILGKPPG